MSLISTRHISSVLINRGRKFRILRTSFQTETSSVSAKILMKFFICRSSYWFFNCCIETSRFLKIDNKEMCRNDNMSMRSSSGHSSNCVSIVPGDNGTAGWGVEWIRVVDDTWKQLKIHRTIQITVVNLDKSRFNGLSPLHGIIRKRWDFGISSDDSSRDKLGKVVLTGGRSSWKHDQQIMNRKIEKYRKRRLVLLKGILGAHHRGYEFQSFENVLFMKIKSISSEFLNTWDIWNFRKL